VLSRLLRYERQVFFLYQIGSVIWSGVLFAFVFLPLLTLPQTLSVEGFVAFLGPTTFLIVLPWIVFTLRFFFFSSIRNLPKQLARYGPADEVVKRIDADLRNLSHAFIDGRLPRNALSPQPDCFILTDQWLIRFCPTGSAIVSLPDLMWVWRLEVAKSAPLTMGKIVNQVGCRMANGDEYRFETWTDRRTHDILEEIFERKPELLAGYQGDCHDLFARGEAAVRTELMARRTRFDAMAPEQQEEWLDRAIEACHRFVVRYDRQKQD